MFCEVPDDVAKPIDIFAGNSREGYVEIFHVQFKTGDEPYSAMVEPDPKRPVFVPFSEEELQRRQDHFERL